MPRYSTKYHLITSLLLNELQREHARNDAQEQELERQRRELDELAALRDRLAAQEASERNRSPGVP